MSVISGRTVEAGLQVVALAPRVPPAAQQLVVNEHLVTAVSRMLSEEDLLALAAELRMAAPEIAALTRQNFLYSGMEPSAELVTRWEAAVRGVMAARENASGSRVTLSAGEHEAPALLRDRLGMSDASEAHRDLIRPPRGCAEAAETVLRLEQSYEGSGRPVALLGAGDYARTEIIPALRAAGLSLQIVADREPQIAALVGQRYGFREATTDPERAIRSLPSTGLVVVATAHDSHAHLACMAAEAGHRVFVEKPPTVTQADAERLAEVMRARPGIVEIGYNRRYHPLVRRAMSWLARDRGPISVACTVKELNFEPDHWYFWANQGSRITGNLCHWIDLAVSLLDSGPLPVSVTLSPRIRSRVVDDEERVLTVTFEDGSLLSVFATTRGDDIRGVQEQIEIRRGHTTITIDDLWTLRVRRGGMERHYRTMFRTKGHGYMYREALGRVSRDEPALYRVRDLIVVSAIQLTASSLVHGDAHSVPVPSWMEAAVARAGHEA